MHAIRQRPIAPLALVLPLALGAISVAKAGEADISPDVLDELERTICIADKNWTESLQALAKGQQVSVEAVAGQTISDPRRREYQSWQTRARENCARLSRSYEARTGTRFDPARCPK